MNKNRPRKPYAVFRICLSCFAGRSRLAGLCTAPLAAEVLAAQIFGEALPLDDETLAAIHPARFYVRKLLKGRPLPKNPDPLLTGHGLVFITLLIFFRRLNEISSADFIDHRHKPGHFVFILTKPALFACQRQFLLLNDQFTEKSVRLYASSGNNNRRRL